jgi:hypothetical protein
VRVTLELFATEDRITGSIEPASGTPIPFSGVLELLRAIEQLHPEPPPATADGSEVVAEHGRIAGLDEMG